jgi:hypothetical protein
VHDRSHAVNTGARARGRVKSGLKVQANLMKRQSTGGLALSLLDRRYANQAV